MSKRIKKRYKTLSQAERYQNRLYEKYESVRLVYSPLDVEDGLYVWDVKQKKGKDD